MSQPSPSPDPQSPRVGHSRPSPALEALRRAPATYGLAAGWVVVYLLMVWDQGTWQYRPGDLLSGGIHPRVAGWFGAVESSKQLLAEPWRAVTATFLHFSLVHLGFNLLIFVQLGRLIEPWYGARLYLFVYVLIAALGNALAAGAKWLLGAKLGLPIGGPLWEIPTAGGSVVICGQIALLAIVGWRSRTRQGAFIKAQMVGMLVFVGFFGLIVPGVDNIGHAGGALAGAALGLGHRALLRAAGTRRAKLLGALALAVLLLSAGFQSRDRLVRQDALRRAVAEARLAGRAAIREQVKQIGWIYNQVSSVPPLPFRAFAQYLAGMKARLAVEIKTLPRPDPASADEPFSRLLKEFRTQAAVAVRGTPTTAQVRDFRRARDELLAALRELDEEDRNQFNPPIPAAPGP